MKSLEIRFNAIAEKKPNLSSYACFAEAITGHGFSDQRMRRWFFKLVERDDYTKDIQNDLLAHLEKLSKSV